MSALACYRQLRAEQSRLSVNTSRPISTNVLLFQTPGLELADPSTAEITYLSCSNYPAWSIPPSRAGRSGCPRQHLSTDQGTSRRTVVPQPCPLPLSALVQAVVA